MIAYISGKAAGLSGEHIIVDQNGIGWEIAYAHTDQICIGDEVKIFTYLHITENDVSLFGFISQAERSLFLKLISVKGLGPRTAMAMLVKSDYEDLINAIEEGNVAFLKSLPGIGAKSASQIVLDLKGKLVATAPSSSTKPLYSQEINEALEALKNLGFKPGEISRAGQYMNQTPSLSAAEYVRMGLKFINKK